MMALYLLFGGFGLTIGAAIAGIIGLPLGWGIGCAIGVCAIGVAVGHCLTPILFEE